MHNGIRTLLVIVGLLTLALTFIFFKKMPMAVNFWSWDTEGRLSFIFMASMQAAIAIAMLWIGYSGELAALAAGGLNLTVMMVGLAVSIFAWIGADMQYGATLGTFCLLFALFNLLLFVWAQRIPIRDKRPIPSLVHYSFMIFIAALLGVGVALLLGWPNVFSWNLPPATSVIFGWMFIGDAFYFGYALYRGRWGLAVAPLLSFLAYDLVLIQPFINRLFTEDLPMLRRFSLTAYICILIYSASLAIYYLVIRAETRLSVNKVAR
ncbi:MAG: hypothetical protein KDE54_05055 [Caldilineaceae bacterium]|nr:hypothetical protein [Caldilineaceae bacterium]MCB0141257.1 hypothetical protein [Caldilineaceae bacterium]